MKKGISILLSSFISALSLTNIASGNFISAQEQEPVEIVSLRSEYEKHFDNGDGTMTAFIDTVPLHYYDNGSWVEIDNTIVEDENGNYVNKGNSMEVTFAPTASADSVDSIDNEQMVSIDYNGYSISWDFVNEQPLTVAYDLKENISIPESHILINENSDIYNIDSEESKLSEITAESVSKLESSISYNSLFNDVDVDIDIRSSSVKETIILNNNDSVPEQFTYYIKAEGLNAEIYEDNSIHFLNEADEDIFIIPAPYMFDSSDNMENNYDIKFNIEDYEDGYLLTLIPDKSWLLSDERIYPVMIDPVVETIRNNITVTTLSEAYPGSYIPGNTVKIGGEVGDTYEALVQLSGFTSNTNSSSLLIDAKFNMYFTSTNNQGNNMPIDIYALDRRGMPFWSNYGGNNGVYIESSLNISNVGQYSFDITKLVQYWLNSMYTSEYTGVYPYGLKLKTRNSDRVNSRIFEAYSNKGAYPPYFEITYKPDSKYSLNYAPHKYNNYKTINNFQNRLNCYGYALQMYYKGYLGNGEYYKLQPGEIGLKQNNSSYKYSVKTYKQLVDGYNSCKSINEILTYTDEQMKKDASEIGFDIDKLSIGNIFKLPSSFNENKQRIIAMIAGYRGASGYEIHYILRNGNGTCTKEGHSKTCSIWSHKPGNNEVTTEALRDYTTLCDENIISQTQTYSERPYKGTYYVNEPWFYTITQDVNIYNSWYENGHKDSSTGTPYYNGG